MRRTPGCRALCLGPGRNGDPWLPLISGWWARRFRTPLLWWWPFHGGGQRRRTSSCRESGVDAGGARTRARAATGATGAPGHRPAANSRRVGPSPPKIDNSINPPPPPPDELTPWDLPDTILPLLFDKEQREKIQEKDRKRKQNLRYGNPPPPPPPAAIADYYE